MLKIVTILILFKIVSGKIIWKPRNTYGVANKQIILGCSVDDYQDRVDWFYKGVDNKVEHLSRNTELKSYLTYKNKMNILYNDEEKNSIKFSLLIVDIQLEDTGVYSCAASNEEGRELYSAFVSVINVQKCEVFYMNRTLAIRCQLEVTGDVEFVTNWRCPVTQKSTGYKERNGTIKNRLYELIPIRDILVGVSVEYSPDAVIKVCSLEIMSIKYNGPRIDDIDHKTPFFEGIIHLKPESSFEGMHCAMEKYLITNLIPILILDRSYNERNGLPIQNYSGNYYECVIPNKVIKQFFMGNEFEQKKYASCEETGGLVCIKNFTILLNMFPGLVDIPAIEHNRLCRTKKDVSKCLQLIQPCSESKKLRGLVTSFYFLCNSKFVSMTKNQVNYVDKKLCSQHYPQTMGNLHIKSKYIIGSKNNNDDDDSVVTDSFCRTLNFFKKLFCVEHLIAANGNFELSQWYLKFMTHKNQIDISRFYEKPFKKSFQKNFLIAECHSDSLDYITESDCVLAEKCLTLYGLIMKSINFGFFYILNFNYLEKHVCSEMESDLIPCSTRFLSKCGIIMANLYKPILALRRAICFGVAKTYPKHQACFYRIYVTHLIQHRCNWGGNYNKLKEKVETSYEKAAQICKMGMAQMECVLSLVRMKCGVGAASVQENLLQVLYTEVFQDLYCRKWFSFKERLSLLKNNSLLLCSNKCFGFVVFIYSFKIIFHKKIW